MDRNVEFTDAAINNLATLDKASRRFILDGIQLHLIDSDPLQTTRNKFPLRRPSVHAERELRLDRWRIFYIVRDDGTLVVVVLVGKKRGNKLIIDGEEFVL